VVNGAWRLKKAFPEIKLLILSVHDEPTSISESIE